jgi:hypothetical protein
MSLDFRRIAAQGVGGPAQGPEEDEAPNPYTAPVLRPKRTPSPPKQGETPKKRVAAPVARRPFFAGPSPQQQHAEAASNMAQQTTQGVAKAMQGNAARVQANKDRMASLMKTHATQQGQIAQAQAMAMRAKHEADAAKYAEDAKMQRLDRVMRSM